MSLESHLLIVDDDERLRELLRKYLAQHGYQVTTAESAEMAESLLKSFDFDLIISDVMMGGKDGISFARDVRQQSQVPIIILTARGQVEDRIMGLEAGADDFIPKPFDPRELLLRIEAILRRVPSDSQPQRKIFKFGKFVFDRNDNKLMCFDERIDITRGEQDLLSALTSEMGRPISRDLLASKMNIDGENVRAVDVHVARLRKKIEDDPKQPLFIQTVRGQGYKLIDPS